MRKKSTQVCTDSKQNVCYNLSPKTMYNPIGLQARSTSWSLSEHHSIKWHKCVTRPVFKWGSSQYRAENWKFSVVVRKYYSAIQGYEGQLPFPVSSPAHFRWCKKCPWCISRGLQLPGFAWLQTAEASVQWVWLTRSGSTVGFHRKHYHCDECKG